MAQQNITAAQTPLLVSDFIYMAKSDDPSLAAPNANPDFISPFKYALPAYAKSYSGAYYQVASATSSPLLFGAPQITGVYGNIYEQTLPTGAIDGGINAVVLSYSSSKIVPEANTLNAAESTWTMDSTNTTNAYWAQRGRTFRAYLPSAYTSSPAWSPDYQREPTYPGSSGDAIDAPADDILTLYSQWKADIR